MISALPLFAATDTLGLPLWLGLTLIPILIAINGYFVAAEFAIVAVRKSRVQELLNQGKARAQALMQSIEQMDTSVAAAQLGITVASLALGLVSEPALAKVLEPLFASLNPNWLGPTTHIISIILTLSLITYMHVVFGEQMPKIAALQSSERIGLIVAVPLNLFARITKPVLRLMNGSSNLFLRWCGYKTNSDHEEVYTVDELRILIEDTEEAGLIEPEAADYLLNVFGLSNKTVTDVMIPKEKIAALELHMQGDAILKAVRDGAHTRMPVYDGELDNIVGVVNTKDLFYLFSVKGFVILDDALYLPQFINANEPVSNALRLFRKTHRPMAIVRDDEKRIVGLITLEDVIEEIVGDIEDEHDEPHREQRLTRALLRRSGYRRFPYRDLPPN